MKLLLSHITASEIDACANGIYSRKLYSSKANLLFEAHFLRKKIILKSKSFSQKADLFFKKQIYYSQTDFKKTLARWFGLHVCAAKRSRCGVGSTSCVG